MGDDLETLNLIKYYINISNTALSDSENKSRLLSEKSVLTALASGSIISFRVAEDNSVSDEVYTTRFIDGQFTPVQTQEA